MVKLKSTHIFLAICALYFLTALTNIGFIAVDDYHHGITYFIPAQSNSAEKVIQGADFRSPLPNIFLLSLSQTAFKLGLNEPANQLRFINFLLSFLALAGVWALAKVFPKESLEQKLSLCLMGFYFGAPLFFTRPLVEALSAPWISFALLFLFRYAAKPKAKFNLELSVLCLAVASLFRFQSGVCFLALPVVIWQQKRPQDFIRLALSSLIAFVLTGLPDVYFKGEFHASLRAYVNFNLNHSSMFGTTPFYSYTLLFLALTLPPTFFRKWKMTELKKLYRPLVPALLFFALFLISHSAVPHKEERFMVPIAPTFLILLVPLLARLHTERSWRRTFFWSVNGLLLPLVCFNTVQNNTVSLANYLNGNQGFAKVIGWEDTLSVFPRALILREDFEVESRTAEKIITQKEWSCTEVIAVRSDKVNPIFLSPERFTRLETFKPGLPEAAVVLMNPGKNARRGPIELYQKSGC